MLFVLGLLIAKRVNHNIRLAAVQLITTFVVIGLGFLLLTTAVAIALIKIDCGMIGQTATLQAIDGLPPLSNSWIMKMHFRFTPTRASWLNQIEIWFSILAEQSLTGASFTSVALRARIDDFIPHGPGLIALKG